MPILHTGSSTLHYEEYGSGYPVLLFAPGFLSSRIERWRFNPARPDVPQPWLDPTAALRDRFRLIALDIRNAGQSRAAIAADDGWHSYTADHRALLAHLGIDKCHVFGACIGVSFALGLAEAMPELVTALVLQNPIGLSGENRAALDREFGLWAKEQVVSGDADPDAIAAFGRNMFGGDFLFSVDRDFVARCHIPMLLMPGSDLVHAPTISADVARLAPEIESLPEWKQDGRQEWAMEQVAAFLARHQPDTARIDG